MPAPRVRLQRLPAAFAPDGGRPVCPRCWSRPDLDWGKGRDGGERPMRGWGVSRVAPAGGDAEAPTTMVAVHRCANHDCPTALEVTMLLAGGYVPAVADAHRLRGADAARYATGRHDHAGVWRDARGEPATAPVQRDLFG